MNHPTQHHRSLPSSAPPTPSIDEQSDAEFDKLPTLYRDRSFWGMLSTQLLGAFNDNLFKQLMLLVALEVAAVDLQWVAMIVFAVPFVMFSGLAGFLSDRYRKQPIIVAAKVAEIAVMLLGVVAFLTFTHTGFVGLLVVLGLMSLQSTFFGPGKYGILPEMLRQSDLPRANGLMLMTTFLAIIGGTAVAGILIDLFADGGQAVGRSAGNVWVGSAVCVLIAVIGTGTSLLIRCTPPASPGMKFRLDALAIPAQTRSMLRLDRPLLWAVLASSMFWGVAGVTQQTVNSLGVDQLQLSKTATSILAAIVGVGIAGGAVIAGKLCRGRADFRIVRIGAWGCVAFLLLLSLPGPHRGHLLGFWGSLPSLALLGVSAGLFAIPLQVFLQSRPPREQKGRMIAVMNQANFTAILLSGVVYGLFDLIIRAADWNRCTIFAFTALLMLPVALFYRPSNDQP